MINKCVMILQSIFLPNENEKVKSHEYQYR